MDTPRGVSLRWSLSFKIIVWAGLLGLVVSGIFLFRALLREREFMAGGAADNASALAELVRKSMRDDMLRNDREGIQRTIGFISGAESLRTVQIYDRFGYIVYSSFPPEIGRRGGRDDAPCRGCHDDPEQPRESLHETRRYTTYRDAQGHRVFSFVEPIYNEPACSAEACHAHAPGTRVLGILLVEFPLERLHQREEQMMANFTLFGLLYILSLAIVGYFVVWRFVLRPIRALSAGMERVAAGDLGHRVPVLARDELGRLAAAFNAMSEELATARRRSERWRQSLEEEVATKTAEIRDSESKLAEAAKLVALGRLTAEIAHEIRNPLTALGGYGRRLQRTVRTVEEQEYARIVVDEASRLENILKDVLDFSSSGHFTFRSEPLTGVVEQSLEAFDMRCVERGIRVAVDLAAADPVPLDAAQVRRAVDNLMANAIDAMPHGGSLAVSTRLEEERGTRYVVVRVEDSGPGIPEENFSRVFEPFWTTKRMGKGTGLGLPITRTIVEAHGGFVRMENRPGRGLTASLWFPTEPRNETVSS